jgi:preprotein translocase subunit SecG
MTSVLLLVHLFVTIALIGVVLIQRSEGGGLGIGTSQGMGSFMSGRGTANLLTRTTAILGAMFFALSLTLALLNRGTGGVGRSLLDVSPASTSAPAAAGSGLPPLPAASAPAVPTTPAVPTAPASAPAQGAAPAATATPSTAPSAPAPAAPAAPSVPTTN